MVDLLTVPAAGAPVWSEVARFAVLTPLFLLLGYASMRYPAAFVVADNPLLVDDAEGVSGPAVAARQLLGFLVAALGVAFALAAAVHEGVRPTTVALLSAGALFAGAAAIRTRARLAAALGGVPSPGSHVDAPDPVAVEYLGIALVLVGVGGVMLFVPVALLA